MKILLSILFFTTSIIAADKLRVTESGNIGINTDSPIERLDVHGNIHLSGIIRLDSVSQIDDPSEGDIRWSGDDLVVYKSSEWVSLTAISSGPTGADGQDGEDGQDGAAGESGDQWFVSAGDPSDLSIESFDSFHLDNETGLISLKISGNSDWTSVGNLVSSSNGSSDNTEEVNSGNTNITGSLKINTLPSYVGASLKNPYGIDGQPFLTYFSNIGDTFTVEAGKVLYITESEVRLAISNSDNTDFGYNEFHNLWVDGGTTVTQNQTNFETTGWISGLIFDEVSELDVISVDLDDSGYIIPEGKKFVWVSRGFSNFAISFSGNTSDLDAPFQASSAMQKSIIIPSGANIYSSTESINGWSAISGYLMDE